MSRNTQKRTVGEMLGPKVFAFVQRSRLDHKTNCGEQISPRSLAGVTLSSSLFWDSVACNSYGSILSGSTLTHFHSTGPSTIQRQVIRKQNTCSYTFRFISFGLCHLYTAMPSPHPVRPETWQAVTIFVIAFPASNQSLCDCRCVYTGRMRCDIRKETHVDSRPVSFSFFYSSKACPPFSRVFTSDSHTKTN